MIEVQNNGMIYTAFYIINVIFGLCGFGVIGGGIYLILKLEFNEYIVYVIGLGIITVALSVFGFFINKKYGKLSFYSSLSLILFIIEAVFAFLVKFLADTTNKIKDYIKDRDKISEEEKDKIINIMVITLGVGAVGSFFSLVCSCLYYSKLNEEKGVIYRLNDSNGEDEFISGLERNS